MDDVMDSIEETCQSIIETMERIQVNQLQFRDNMMQLLEILEKKTRKK